MRRWARAQAERPQIARLHARFERQLAYVGRRLQPHAASGLSLTAGLLGAFNGVMTAYVGISSFVATLGMYFFLGGLTLVLSHSTQVNLPGTSILGHGSFVYDPSASNHVSNPPNR